MPIRPENRSRYPKDWKEIVARIRVRSKNKCELCGVENGAVGYRQPDGTFVKIADSIDEAGERIDALEYDGIKCIRIVLTTMHLDHTPENCGDENLKHACQRCHLNYDKEHHQHTAYRTRRNNGTLEMNLQQEPSA